ncbi:MAG: putative ABC transporter permease [Azoarcus sp.]|nr:putative ABC transporter permease [Azoarcus sp.]
MIGSTAIHLAQGESRRRLYLLLLSYMAGLPAKSASQMSPSQMSRAENLPSYIYFYLFLLYSFIGWVYETILFSVQEHSFINRGFNFGPYVPIYGFGAVMIMYLIFQVIGNRPCTLAGINVRPLAVFLLIGVVATLAELLASYIMEYAFGLVMWDYHGYWLNFQGRIAFWTSFIFAAGGAFCFYVLQPLAKRLLNLVSLAAQKKLAIVLFCVVALDFAVSVVTTVWFPDAVAHPGVVGRK